MEETIRDLRHSLRSLRRQPGFTAVVLLTLALGIGANTAIFSVVSAVLLRPLPFAEPERLVRVWSAYPSDDVVHGTTSPLDLADWRAQSSSFAAIAGYPNIRLNGFVLTGGDAPEELETMFVTEGFFEVFGVAPLRGRSLVPSDQVEGDNRVVVLGEGAWRRRFGAAEDIVGRTLVLNGDPFTVVGVMPASFEYPSAGVELWAPVSLIPESGVPRLRFVRWMSVVARLADGVSIEQAGAEMNAITSGLAAEYTEANEDLTGATIEPLHEHLVGDIRPAMLAVFAAVGLVLLIGCANVANLVLARTESRAREVALRVALGAGRARLLRQVLTESLVLSLAGGLLGVFIALAGVRALLGMAPPEIPRLSGVAIDGTVLAFTILLSALAGVAFGSVAALRVISTDLQDTLKEGGRGSSLGGGALRGSLVVAEVALVVVLAIGAGLLVRSYASLLSVDPGFVPDNVLTLRVAARGDDTYVDFFGQVLDSIRALPAVAAAGMVRPLPLAGDTFEGESFSFTIPGRPAAAAGEAPEAYLRFVSPGYFDAMGIPLLSGRDFRAGDDRAAPFVVVISREAAERYWDGADPVGSTIAVGDNQATIVGMVSGVRQMSLSDDPAPVIYVAHRQVSRVGMTMVVRLAAGATPPIAAIQQAIWRLRPDQPINEIASMQTVIGASVARPRFSMTLLALFAGLALCLAAVGIYGVVSYSVGRRTREIGVRMALGADRTEVLRAVVGGGLKLSVIGLCLGLLGALGLGRVMGSLLYGIGALDPVTFGAVAVLLLAVALLASAVPALRASRVSPVVALRSE